MGVGWERSHRDGRGACDPNGRGVSLSGKERGEGGATYLPQRIQSQVKNVNVLALTILLSVLRKPGKNTRAGYFGDPGKETCS